jgi:spoIIIJ-associated protein
MQWVEVTGRTVEEAKEAALDQLGVDEHDAEFEVLEEPKSGLFGRLRAEARVRARVVPTAPRPKVERRDRKRRERRDRPASSERSRTKSAQRGEGDGVTSEEQRGAGQGAGDGEPAREAPTLAEEAAVGEDFLRGLLEVFGVRAEVGSAELDEETLELRVEGDDLGLLIGPRGQTLAAVQELTRTVVQRKLGSRSGRLLVDVAAYRQKRREALERFTRQVAEQVKEAGVPTALEPMTPPDRKVVHDTVNEIPGVSTTSEGEEPHRRVVILPGEPGEER